MRTGPVLCGSTSGKRQDQFTTSTAINESSHELPALQTKLRHPLLGAARGCTGCPSAGGSWKSTYHTTAIHPNLPRNSHLWGWRQRLPSAAAKPSTAFTWGWGYRTAAACCLPCKALRRELWMTLSVLPTNHSVQQKCYSSPAFPLSLKG